MKIGRIVPPVAVHVVWHRSDGNRVCPLLSILEKVLLRDVSHPFSCSVNVPLYYYNTENVRLLGALDRPSKKGEVDVIIVFLSPSFVGAEGGADYLRGIAKCGKLVPVWLDQCVGRVGDDSFDTVNAIRLYEYSNDYRDRWGALLVAHEVYRCGLGVVRQGEPGKNSSLKLFLSHAKADVECEKLVKRVKAIIQQTNLSQFYDKTEISPGFRFDSEIMQHVAGSTVIAFRGDHYAARYWCQQEIITAKEKERPIVVCDMLESSEDRHFTMLSNLPTIRVDSSDVTEEVILDLLLVAIRETIRCCYIKKMLKRWMTVSGRTGSTVLIRPPEAGLVVGRTRKVIYPDPPLYDDELKWCGNAKVSAVTPLWDPRFDKDVLRNFRVGISVSDPDSQGYGKWHVNGGAWKRFAQDVGRNILMRRGTVVYGGDMREGGITECLLEEAARLKDRECVRSVIQPIVNYLAWPIHLHEEDVVRWRNRHAVVLDTRCLSPAKGMGVGLDANVFLPPTTPENCFVWARCLTAMRKQMIGFCNARICLGGRSTGYKGSMPGVLEEVIIAIENHVPLYLLGGFGGIVGQVCDLINKKEGKEIDERWQTENNPGYAALLNVLKDKGVAVDYVKIRARLKELAVEKLAHSCGLTKMEYAILMNSDFVDECVYLINKGLAKIARERKHNGRG